MITGKLCGAAEVEFRRQPLKNGGRGWWPKSGPVDIGVHEFPDPQLAKIEPYGVSDLDQTEGCVGVGTGHTDYNRGRITV